mgnify:CR=1 FL=1|tara:strand:- start:16592 stop:17011 length:420 start_codon:yes stop_codon:yes gene_type:complete
MKDLDKLESIFNMSRVEPVKPIPLPKIEETSDNKEESDFDLARDTLRDLINKNNDIIDEMTGIAKQTEKGRDFEVAGQLVKNQSEVAKDLLDLHKQKKDLEGDNTKIDQQNNIVFAGSTSDLMKIINDKKKTIDVNNEK